MHSFTLQSINALALNSFGMPDESSLYSLIAELYPSDIVLASFLLSERLTSWQSNSSMLIPQVNECIRLDGFAYSIFETFVSDVEAWREGLDDETNEVVGDLIQAFYFPENVAA